MAEKLNATCSICGKKYYKCISCQSVMQAAPWKQYTDTSEHYKIFQVIKGYNIGVYTKDEANEKLKSIDLSDLNELLEGIRDTIADIMNVDAAPAVNSVEAEAPTFAEDNLAVDASVIEASEEKPQRPYMNRKNKYSKSKFTDVNADTEV